MTFDPEHLRIAAEVRKQAGSYFPPILIPLFVLWCMAGQCAGAGLWFWLVNIDDLAWWKGVFGFLPFCAGGIGAALLMRWFMKLAGYNA